MKAYKSYLSHIFILPLLVAATDGKASEPKYKEALKAYEDYWQSFENYDNKKIKDSNDKYHQRWQELKSDYDKKMQTSAREQFARLKESVKQYQLQLQEHPDSENRPYVLLNLAQVYSLMSSLETEENTQSNLYLDHCIKITSEIARTYPNFEHIDNTLYLQATALDQLDRKDDALKAWQKLAQVAKGSKYGLYAILGMGDYYFDKDNTPLALDFYRKAQTYFLASPFKDDVYEALRIQYRRAWAAYRTADLEESIEAATGLLSLRNRVANPEQQKKVFDDAIELTGDALYEKNDFATTKRILKQQNISAYADSIGDRILKRFDTNNIHASSVAVGEFILQEFPLSKHLPEWHLILARAYEAISQKKKKVESYERLAMLLPSNSLWQSKFRHDYHLVNKMKEHAEQAARFVAAYYYDTGIATGNASYFMTSASYYGILFNNLPGHKEASHWRIRQAHCYYFGNKLDRAIENYNYIVNNIDLSESQLEITLYQLALASEKVWREKFMASGPDTDDLTKREEVTKDLRAFADRSEKFANRFPDNARSVDLLLLTASAYRDSKKYDVAQTYWKRALVSSPSVAQRLIAIRGLIYAEINTGTHASVVDLTSRFLKLEDWNKVDRNFRFELLGILSAALSQASDLLNKESKPVPAGQLLVKRVGEFKDLPNRERLFRDGAYYYALGDDWRQAQLAAHDYLNEGLQQYRADMLYLSARSHEFQLNFRKSAQEYLELAEKFPTHRQAIPGLSKAEHLAISDKDWVAAGNAATLLSQLESGANRSTHLARAIEHYGRAERFDLAKKASQLQLQASSDPKSKYQARINSIRARQRNGEEENAAKELNALATELQSKRLLTNPEYQAIVSETFFLLGEDTHGQFDDFNLEERSGSLINNSNFKMKIFEKMIGYYDQAITAGDPEWSTRARYNSGIAAGDLADQLAKAHTKSQPPLGAETSNNLNQMIQRLRKLQTSYHSQNVLARTKNPILYKNNTWINRSQSFLDHGEISKRDEPADELLPLATYSDLSNSWSH